MATFRWSDDERGWTGFLVDLCVQELTPIFEQMGFDARITGMRHDPQTVHEAWEESRTVVTVNERHFIRDTNEHQKRDSGKECNNAWGLLIVPSHAGKRARWLPTLKNGVKVGNEIIPWPAVAYANLCVTLHADGTVTFRRFRRCLHCSKAYPIKEKWYEDLAQL